MLDHSQIFSSVWWLPLAMIAIGLFRSAWFKGVMGEAMVNLAARLFLNKHDYHLIRNITGHERFACKREASLLTSLCGLRTAGNHS